MSEAEYMPTLPRRYAAQLPSMYSMASQLSKPTTREVMPSGSLVVLVVRSKWSFNFCAWHSRFVGRRL